MAINPDKIHLFGVVEVGVASGDQKAEEIGKRLIEKINGGVFGGQSRGEVIDGLINGEVEPEISGLLLVMVCQDQVWLGGKGTMRAKWSRGERYCSWEGENWVQKGKIHQGDRLVFVNRELELSLAEDQQKRWLVEPELNTIEEEMGMGTREGSKLGGVINFFDEGGEEVVEEESQPSVDLPTLADNYHQSRNWKKMILVGGIVLMLAGLVVASGKVNQGQGDFDKKLADIETRVGKVEQIAGADRPTAIAEARNIEKEIESMGRQASDEQKSQLEKINQKIRQILGNSDMAKYIWLELEKIGEDQEADKIIIDNGGWLLNSKTGELYAINIEDKSVSKDGSRTGTGLIRGDEEGVVWLVSADGWQRYDPKTKTWSVKEITLDDAKARWWNGALYRWNQERGKIEKSILEAGRLREFTDWSKGASQQGKEASLAINGEIYLAIAGGEIFRYNRGSQVEGEEIKLEAPIEEIKMGQEGDNLLIWQTGGVLTIRNLASRVEEKIDMSAVGIVDFDWNEREKTIWVLGGDRNIYRYKRD